MKKIMFSTEYGLHQGVISSTKTMTRRVERIDFFPGSREEQIEKFSKRSATDAKGRQVWLGFDNKGNWIAQLISRYAIGSIEREIEKEGLPLNIKDKLRKHKGWTNKMFVRADLMPHRIRITNIRVERLQDISDEDCLREGIYDVFPYIDRNPKVKSYWFLDEKSKYGYHQLSSVRDCFALLIDKVSGKGTWERNPWVLVYEFELVNQQRVRIELKQTKYGTDNKE